jgi:hypothetical protein
VQINSHGLQNLLGVLHRGWAENVMVMNTLRHIAAVTRDAYPRF